MRWLLIALAGLGAAFVLLMLLAPGREGAVPGWTKGLGAALTRFAPRVEAFSDGSTRLEFSASGDVTRNIGPAPGKEWRILALRLVSGNGPVRVIYHCAAIPNAPCDDDAQVLCLGARHPDCEQDKIGATGSFAISAGGGEIRIITPDRAVLRIDD